MVHATTMTLVMAEKDPPVFRDFLGIGREDESTANKQVQPSMGFSKRNNSGFDEDGEAETSARASSGNSGRLEGIPAPGLSTRPFAIGFPTSSEPGSEGWQRARSGAIQHQGVKSAFYKPEIDTRPLKKRDSPIGRESLQERLQMSVEALENSRPQKSARLDDKKGKFRTGTPTMDELRLSMQPPRPSSKGLVTLQTSVAKTEVIPRGSSKQDRSKTPLNVGGSTPGRLSHMGMSSERQSGQLAMETIGLSPILPPAADEGSRTGMKGSGLLSSLQQQTVSPSSQVMGMSGGPSPTPRRPKVSTHSAGPDTALPSRHQFPKPPSRQLTIFYGGEAHVYDDVPPDKAEHIMQLASSNGRSWSTTYSPRQTASIANSASEGSLSAMEREKNVNLSRGPSVSGGGNLALSPEIQTLLRGLAQSGGGRSGQSLPEAAAPPSSAEIQLAVAERVAGAANGNRKDSLERRVLTRPSPCTEDNAEALVRGQHWM